MRNSERRAGPESSPPRAGWPMPAPRPDFAKTPPCRDCYDCARSEQKTYVGGADSMWHTRAIGYALAAALLAAFAFSGERGYSQNNPDPNAAPNPYRLDEGWAKLPAGRKWGAVFGL